MAGPTSSAPLAGIIVMAFGSLAANPSCSRSKTLEAMDRTCAIDTLRLLLCTSNLVESDLRRTRRRGTGNRWLEK
jgi:hypothetical protein